MDRRFANFINGAAPYTGGAMQPPAPPVAVAPTQMQPPVAAQTQGGFAPPTTNRGGQALPQQASAQAQQRAIKPRKPMMFNPVLGQPTDPVLAAGAYAQGVQSRSPFARPGLNEGFRTWLQGRR